MGIDAYLLYERRPGVSRAEVSDAFGDRDLVWHADRSFSLFTGFRFHDWEHSDRERRIRIALGQIPEKVFGLIEPYALAWPDVADHGATATASQIAAAGALRVDFADYTPGDPRLDHAAEAEMEKTLASVSAMVAFSKYQSAHPDFDAEMSRLARSGDLSGMMALTAKVPELAPLRDQLVAAKFFETFVKSTR